jgi:hypothetical protein
MRCSQCRQTLSPIHNSDDCPHCGTPIQKNIHNPIGVSGIPVPINTLAESNLSDEPSTQPILPEPPLSPNPGNYSFPTDLSNRYAPPNLNWNTTKGLPHTATQAQTETSQVAFPSQQTPQIAFPETENRSEMTYAREEQQVNRSSPFSHLSSPSTSDLSNLINYANPIKQAFDINPASATSIGANKPLQPNIHPAQQAKGSSSTTRLALTIAGLCIFAGGFLLVFIYLIEQGFLLENEVTSPLLSTMTPITQTHQSPTAQAQVTPTPITASPTAVLPGQDLLDTATLASQFNEQTGQIIQLGTTFAVNQKFYIVFSLHPGGQSNLVCLSWYLNNQQVSSLYLRVNPASNYSYFSYITMSAAGPGRVDVSVTSTNDCTAALLARQLPFTIN